MHVVLEDHLAVSGGIVPGAAVKAMLQHFADWPVKRVVVKCVLRLHGERKFCSHGRESKQ